MLLNELLSWGIQALKDNTSTPTLDAEILLCHVLQLTRAQLLIHKTSAITASAENQFKQLIQRRKLNEPIAYLTGYREFWSLTLEVTSKTLIPRPETELLVEIILEKFPTAYPIHLADLGTGSGAIALAIAYEKPQWFIVAIDYSKDALRVAQNNAKRLNLQNITFLQNDWCAGLAFHTFDVIVANPPYIAVNDLPLLQKELSFEPITALVADEEGLKDIKHIAEQAKEHLLEKGWIMIEHGYAQGAAVREILFNNGYLNVKTYHDLSGNERVTIAQT